MISENDEREFFTVRILRPMLVISFRRPCQVVSWAPLHGGFRSNVSHIVDCQVAEHSGAGTPETVLRRTAGKAGIKGTFVGMLTSADIQNYWLVQSQRGGLRVAALSTITVTKLATVGEAWPAERPCSLNSGGLNLIVVANQRLSHEAMLESISIATEAKVKALCDFQSISRPNEPHATGTAFECIVVASGNVGHHKGAGKGTELGELIGKTCLESIRGGLRSVNRS